LTEPQRSAVLRAVELAENHALTISLDPGLTPATLDDLRTLLARIDILLPTLAEAQAITGLTAADDCALALLSRGVQTVALKLGKDGCLVSSKDGRFRIPAFPIEARDSTGAGDSFDAGFLMAHLKGLDSHACAVLANAMGALAAAQVGAGTQALTPQAALFFLRERRYTQGHQEHSRAIEQVICFLEGVFAPPCFV
jgi:2-dehydro-3-deoxygluconokinase